ncbi:MAG: metallophosphoesterase [Chloroflexia bacterium]|nr:metallophosphoesterase [Chloroflexia bacterium]
MRLGILTDIHLSPPDSAPTAWHNPYQLETVRERLTKSIQWLETEGVDRIAVLGDLTHHGDEPSLREVVDILATSRVPVGVLPGNHDLTPDIATIHGVIEAAGHDAVEALSSQPVPLDGAWRVAGLPIERAPGVAAFVASPAPDPDSWGEGPVLVLSHFPVLSLREECVEAGLKFAGDLVNVGEVAGSLIERTAPTFVINGHLHVRHAASRGSVLQAACGAQVESLFEATLVDFGNWSRGRITWTSTPIGDVWPGVAPALSDANQAWTWDGAGWQT